MATPGRPDARPLSQRLRAEPHTFEWLQALLLLEREQPDATPLGQGSLPQAEALRLRGPLTPVFEASQISALEEIDGRPQLRTAIFGLGGADGALPYAYQEWLQQRARLKDHAPGEFLDLFQHRLLSLLYRVLRKHRLALGHQAPAQAPLQRPLRALVGLLPHGLQERGALPDSAILARGARFAGNRRSLAGFASMVRQQFAVAARCDAYAGAWRAIPPASRSVLGRGAANLGLGRDAVAGTRVWDEHSGFHLQLGPFDEATARRFLPDGQAYPLLLELCALYFGPDLQCRLRLLVRASGPLALRAGTAPRLNWNTGLRRDTDALQAIDLNLRPAEMT
ncbi:type VI secretion system baseplate subunit TssG [Pseudomonas sp. GD04087]|uniref:type VI secretion system baseplate subunit TssG n=1 Tax=unclassified Pseudomonas TaxID=196821 RepID=UPI002447BE7C|nr:MULTISPECIES: type VI secretion system baseplate subunit TssG [unclassified Pseudomonas]MDH0292036.1 type VI secretion system baseplate subunit TssG [Pseudomonas sp. GD04087]MDH1052622.1 type VI secretion system baseplate subunit TssG [Pseudomonas sp. GD03903]MDH2001479.1 type VI secretion system baseplate subunit TssG [Pseudomonas sp. GD03691]